MASRCDRSSEILYTWAEQSDFAEPFVDKALGQEPRGRYHRLRGRGRRRRWWRRFLGRTGSSTPSLTASSAATSSESRCSRRSNPMTSPACAAASTTSLELSPVEHRHKLETEIVASLPAVDRRGRLQRQRCHTPCSSGHVHPHRPALLAVSNRARLRKRRGRAGVCRRPLATRQVGRHSRCVSVAAIWPANLQDAISTQQGDNLPLKIAIWFRLPLQVPLIWFALQSGRSKSVTTGEDVNRAA